MIEDDPYLKPHEEEIKSRWNHLHWLKSEIEKKEGSLDRFSQSYKQFGLHARPDCVEYREWAPAAKELSLWGDFQGWDPKTRVPMVKDEFGVWSCKIPNKPDGSCAILHNSKVKAHIRLPSGEESDRIPAWIFCTSQDGTNPLDGRFWNPPEPYVFQHPRPPRPKSLRIYESHVGMSSEEGKVNSYRAFADDVLPYIKATGYNAVELMAVMEHAYYASFGYHVTNFFSIAGRSGLPCDLKYLIDKAHSLGLVVVMDVVHSHASKNVLDGLGCWDGSGHQYFHEGPKGNHDLWDSKLFDYANWEVLRFLLSNLRYWVEEYQFDGFRFDGVSSMLYFHHGLGVGFSGGYHEYFGPSVDRSCLAYLTLANHMLHEMYPFIITIAEDVSGMPGICRSTKEGGIGFDYRLAMAIPDKWIEILKKYKDEDWDVGNIVFTLTNRRYKEPVVAYAESHDQALVGDKTIAFWLMDKEMYDWMTVTKPETPIIDRGMALHKMIRLITCGLGGEAYLTFMGNEFGHPEWIDFPREGNANSYHHCRRQWGLVKDGLLRYKFLYAFEVAMNALEEKHNWLSSGYGWVSKKDKGDLVISFERGGDLLFVFNFHPTKSYTDYRMGVMKEGKYRVVLDSDAEEFGGHCRLDHSVEHVSEPVSADGHYHSINLYLPNRTALVLQRL